MPKTQCCCSGQTSCCTEIDNENRVTIDFLYLDLESCDRCLGTEASLDQAISEVARILEVTGRSVTVNKIQVTSEEQARELGFVSSPTIRINGRDLQLDVRENYCEACSDISGEEVACRVWVYRGQQYDVPPKAMIVDAILAAVYGKDVSSPQNQTSADDVPDNLKRFFAGKEKNSCCSSNSKCC